MPEVVRTIVIDSRFSGPPGLGNGGYVAGGRRGCGGLRGDGHPARSHPPRHPPRSDCERRRGAVGGRRGRRRPPGGAPARGRTARRGDCGRTRPFPPPPAPDRATAAAATARYSGRAPNLYQECFVCGFAREPGSGLRVFAGPTAEPGLVAADWPVHPGLGDASGAVPDEFLWGALDCPGAYAVGTADLRLGRMTARVSGRVRPGERCTVAGWRLGSERRKHFTGTAVYGEAGNLVALASSVWIAPRKGGPGA